MKCKFCGKQIIEKINRIYQCRGCYRINQNKYRAEHREKMREHQKKANAKRKKIKPEEVKKYDREYKKIMYATDEEYRNRIKERVKRGRQKYRATIETYRRRLKQDALDAYGGNCECCGEDKYEFMAIDHINGGGKKHRDNNKIGGGQQFYRWLKNNNYPAGFRVLCHNCNMAHGLYGYCPHKTESKYGKKL